MIPTLKYIRLTIVHKWFVFLAGLKTGAPIWRLIIHDWSKFTPSEAPHYGRQFFGGRGDPEGFAVAWLHHQNHNPHHWEYWISRSGHNRGTSNPVRHIPMPLWAIREMVADWFGATRAYSGYWPTSWRDWEWLKDNLGSTVFPNIHASTRVRLMDVLEGVLGPCPFEDLEYAILQGWVDPPEDPEMFVGKVNTDRVLDLLGESEGNNDSTEETAAKGGDDTEGDNVVPLEIAGDSKEADNDGEKDDKTSATA